MISPSAAPSVVSYTQDDLFNWMYLKKKCYERALLYAHPQVIFGLSELGILNSTIPDINSLNQKLEKYDWQVVPVTGFLAPREYLSCLAKRRLPIAVNMRSTENLSFSAEPDIFHEAFGHVCMLVDASYGRFLQNWGTTSLYAFKDPNEEMFYAEVISKTETKSLLKGKNDLVSKSELKIRINSEATQLARLGWWTVECGVIHNGNAFQCYGAALLSSSREMDRMTKNPILLRAGESMLDKEFDPTELQPQYYYIQSFNELHELLDKFAQKMAYRAGGLQGLQVALKSHEKAVCRFLSGITIRGKIFDYKVTMDNSISEITYFCERTNGMRSHKCDATDRITSVYPLETERYLKCSI